MNLEILYEIIMIFAGMGVIMYGIKVVNGVIESSLGLKFKKILAKQNGKTFKNFLLGSGVSFAVQTSTLTNVMTTGLVSIGTISLSQGFSICLGATFGASLALVLLMFESISLIKILSLLVFVGAILFVVGKSKKTEFISKIFLGFGLLCLGITLLSGSIESVLNTVDLTSFFANLTNPAILFLIGMVLTMLMQSGYPVIVILVTLVSSGMLSFTSAAFAVVGNFVGSSLVVSLFMACFGDGKNGERIFVFNFISKFIVAIIISLLMLIPNWLEFVHNSLFFSNPNISLIVFNIFVCLLPIMFLPFVKYFEKFLKIIMKDKKGKSNGEFYSFELDETQIGSGVLAYTKIKQNINKIFILQLELGEDINSVLFSGKPYVQNKPRLKTIERAIKLTNNNLIRVGGKYFEKDAEKINIWINILSNMSQILKVYTILDEYSSDKKMFKKELSNSQQKFLADLNFSVCDVGKHVEKLFDENLSKKQKADELKLVFKINDILISDNNKAKQSLIKNNTKKDNSVYFNLTYQVDKLQKEYIDIAIKMALLEE